MFKDKEKLKWHLILNPGQGEVALCQEMLAGGLHPHRQYMVGPYYLDVALPEYKLAIEVDDSRKFRGRAKKRRQAKRTAYIEGEGWQFVRVLNTADPKIIWEVLEEALTGT